MKFPKSVLSYFNDESVRTAVDHLLASKEDFFPRDLQDWSAARGYVSAQLAAQQVRFEFTTLHFDLWEEIWGAAVAETRLQAKLLSYRKQYSPEFAYAGDPPNASYVWDNDNYHVRLLEHPSAKNVFMELGVTFGEGGAQIYFAECDAEEERSLVLRLPAPWSAELNDAGWRFTPANAFALDSSNEELDLSELRKLARAALEGLKDRNREG